MTSRASCPCVLALLVVAPVVCHAQSLPQPQLSVTSATALDSIQVGQVFTVDVSLSFLPNQTALETLAATVRFDAALLGTPLLITAGAIVPDPLYNPNDFLTAHAPGLADATFQTFGINPPDFINTNGVFMSFTIQAQTPGQGAFSFDFVDALQFNPADPGNPIGIGLVGGPDLPFTVVTPAPSSLFPLLASLGLVTRRRQVVRI